MANKLISISEKLTRHNVSDNGCWIWNSTKDKDGYGVFTHHRNKQIRAHRASYEFYVGDIPDGAFICHKCDTPACINPNHLFIGTAKENTRDMITKGRKASLCGSDHRLSKLTESNVIEIRKLHTYGLAHSEIAKCYGVVFQTISSVVRRKTWGGI